MKQKTKIIIISSVIGLIGIIIGLILYFTNKKDNNSRNKNIKRAPLCSKKPYYCNDSSECTICQETYDGVEMSCIPLSKDKKSLKTCLPTKINRTACNYDIGATDVWAGYDNPPRMEWDCMCGDYSDWFSGVDLKGKTTCALNPDICQYGTFNWDPKSGKQPSADNCTCNENPNHFNDCCQECNEVGVHEKPACMEKCSKLYQNYSYHKIINNKTGKPICVPKDPTTTNMYTKTKYSFPAGGSPYIEGSKKCPGAP